MLKSLTVSKGGLALIAGLTATFSTAGVLASGDGAIPTKYPWYHHHPLHTLDHGAMRRGFQVYKEVCSACHSLKYMSFRNLVEVTHTEAEAKEIAASYDIVDGPNDAGEMFTRPGKLFDRFPSPYPNEEAARAANGGAYPPDLSLMIEARHGGEDYLFSLLTGFQDPPAGITFREGLHYNPFFPGGAIGMARPLYDDMIEYEDGTPATTSQMAKDVTTFLVYCADIHFDDRHRIGFKVYIVLSVLTGLCWYLKRFKWSILKSRKMIYNGGIE